MTIGWAILLGLIQGIAEFLPISSSGHLSIIQNLFHGQTAEGHMLFDVLLHLGTLISVCVVYWSDIVNMVRGLIALFRRTPSEGGGTRTKNAVGARLFLMLVLGTLPLFLVLPLQDYVEQLYYNTTFIGIVLILTGVMLFAGDRLYRGRKNERTMTVGNALFIGLCQAIATIPGLSRSGTTITAGVAAGLDRTFAVRYSFLLSLPAILGANILSLIKACKTSIDISLLPAYLIGMAVAMISGIAAIGLVKFITNKAKFGNFAYYCWAAGLLTVILSLVL
ncbi:MAG: undecaprenyl-diphosphate phosphatase [Clostridiales bacterium]|nr:undecaprenyl-diphosphate phosphatase [Clostridiales bacterium]